MFPSHRSINDIMRDERNRAILENCRERRLIEVSKKVKKSEMVALIARINRNESLGYDSATFFKDVKGVKAQRAEFNNHFRKFITWVK